MTDTLPSGLVLTRRDEGLTTRDRTYLAASRPASRIPVMERQTPDGIIQTQLVHAEVFDLEHCDFGPLRFFISDIKEAILSEALDHTVFQATLTEDWYAHILRNNGIEEPRISAMTPRDLRPLPIAVMTGLSDANFIDGSHRLVYRWRVGVPTFRFIMVHILDLVRLNLVLTGPEARKKSL